MDHAPSAVPDRAPAPKITEVQRGLLGWYRDNARDLPWRRTRDPYRILVSEVMLQQTQVDRVIPYYETFLKQFPSVEALAAAPTANVIRAWAGLGYNRRAVNLQRTAQAVVKQHGGKFPHTVEGLRELPGIGPYTAGAIACFAFEQDVPFVDTNMRRVLHRLFIGVDVPQATAPDKEIVAVARDAIPPGRGWEWNQALIEFGALQCTARKPACLVCPLQAECDAFPAIQTVLATLPKGVRLKREAPFSGSNRFYRGRVIAALREHPPEDQAGLDLHSLGALVREDYTAAHLPWLYEVVQGLSKDGLAVIAEDSPSYDASTGDASATDASVPDIRVRLP